MDLGAVAVMIFLTLFNYGALFLDADYRDRFIFSMTMSFIAMVLALSYAGTLLTMGTAVAFMGMNAFAFLTNLANLVKDMIRKRNEF